MKLSKSSLLAMALFVGLTSAARANLVREFTYALHPDTPQNSYDAALNHFDHFTRLTFFNCIDRVNGEPAGTIISGEFTIDFNSDQSATISWNLTSTDHFFLGVYVAGGAEGGNLYENLDDVEGGEFKGTAVVHAPREDNGSVIGISHIDFFCGRVDAVPDFGGTFVLLSSALAGLLLIRRAAVR